jgi:hypothetical protein
MPSQRPLRHPSKPVLVHIFTADIIALDALAVKKQLTRSAVMRDAIKHLLQCELDSNGTPAFQSNKVDSDAGQI